jgi:hypothetical protein
VAVSVSVVSIVGVAVRVGLGVRLGFKKVVAVDSEGSVLPPAQATNPLNPIMVIINNQVRNDFLIPVLPNYSYYYDQFLVKLYHPEHPRITVAKDIHGMGFT